MKKVEVSIILSTKNFNEIENLEENFKNSEVNYEVIAVGPSKKSSQNSKFKYIQSYTKPVQCLEIAKNSANGEWIIIWSDDMFFENINQDNLRKLITYSNNKPNSLISCRLINEINKNTDSYRYNPSNLSTPILPFAAPIKKDVTEKIGFYDKNFIATFADLDLYLRLMSEGYIVEFSDINIIEKHKSKYSLNSDYHYIDRKTLNKFWLESINLGQIKRKFEFSSFEESQLNIPQGPRGRWIYNNSFYFNYCLRVYFKIINDLLKYYKIKKFTYIFFKKIQINAKKFFFHFF